jgi:hypothetical protein
LGASGQKVGESAGCLTAPSIPPPHPPTLPPSCPPLAGDYFSTGGADEQVMVWKTNFDRFLENYVAPQVREGIRREGMTCDQGGSGGGGKAKALRPQNFLMGPRSPPRSLRFFPPTPLCCNADLPQPISGARSRGGHGRSADPAATAHATAAAARQLHNGSSSSSSEALPGSGSTPPPPAPPLAAPQSRCSPGGL